MPTIARRGLMLVLSSASGAGKSTIARALLERDPALSLSVSVTSRAPRPGEVDGVHYHFRPVEEARRMGLGGEMLEWAEVFGNVYGTPRAPVEAALSAGRDVVFDIDWQGHRQLVAAAGADVVGVFILPPSVTELESRLRGRGQDSDEVIRGRMAKASDEMSHWDEYAYTVVNQDLEASIAAVQAIIHAERLKRERQTGMPAFVTALRGG